MFQLTNIIRRDYPGYSGNDYPYSAYPSYPSPAYPGYSGNAYPGAAYYIPTDPKEKIIDNTNNLIDKLKRNNISLVEINIELDGIDTKILVDYYFNIMAFVCNLFHKDEYISNHHFICL